MKVLITGASGYIGRHVVKAFLNKGHEVYASDFAFKGIDEKVNRVYDDIFSGDKNIYDSCQQLCGRVKSVDRRMARRQLVHLRQLSQSFLHLVHRYVTL